MCISETWLSSETPNEYIVIPIYVVYRYDKGKEGGACIYIKDKVTPVEVNIIRPQGVKDVWVGVRSCKLLTAIIGSWY